MSRSTSSALARLAMKKECPPSASLPRCGQCRAGAWPSLGEASRQWKVGFGSVSEATRKCRPHSHRCLRSSSGSSLHCLMSSIQRSRSPPIAAGAGGAAAHEAGGRMGRGGGRARQARCGGLWRSVVLADAAELGATAPSGSPTDKPALAARTARPNAAGGACTRRGGAAGDDRERAGVGQPGAWRRGRRAGERVEILRAKKPGRKKAQVGPTPLM